MDLQGLGFDAWFREHADSILQPGQSLARVMTVDRGAFLVRSEGGETYAETSGRYRFAVESDPDLPCVGDWVCVEHASQTLLGFTQDLWDTVSPGRRVSGPFAVGGVHRGIVR